MTSVGHLVDESGDDWFARHVDALCAEADPEAFAAGVELWMAGLQDHARGREYVGLLGDQVKDTRRGT